ncbi:MAG: M23 family metallopeptidase [Akkermansiaceae bacterium]|nr:M23 family metallopeptidase [Akkermansiaceae bacterium]
MGKLPLPIRIALVLLIATGILVWLLVAESRDHGDVERVAFQSSGAPLPMPDEGLPDHRFEFLSAWEMAKVPVATRFDPPMGHLTYNAQPFWEMNEKRGGHHAGDDLNGIGGMNTDFGDPIYAIADGLVVYAGEPSAGWGKILVVAHRTPDGRQLHSMYAHLDKLHVPLGAMVARGQVIGTNGTGNDHYPAHLHFELRETENIDIRGGYLNHKLNLLDPQATIAELRGAGEADFSPSPLRLAMEQWKRGWTEMEIQGAEHFLRTQEK